MARAQNKQYQQALENTRHIIAPATSYIINIFISSHHDFANKIELASSSETSSDQKSTTERENFKYNIAFLYLLLSLKVTVRVANIWFFDGSD